MARRLSRPRQLARDLLVEVGARTPEQIDPIETAKEKGIEVTFGHLTGATARIYMLDGRARIRVSDHIVREGRRRVSIMHEVGHFVLGHELARHGDHASWFRTSCEHRDPTEERDADVLAIEHLTPESMVRPYCTVTPVDLAAVKVIERVFKASPVMAAIRLVELSPEACAVVYSENGRIVWMKPSKTFPSYFTKGTAIPQHSIAAQFFANGSLIEVPRVDRALDWFGSTSRVRRDVELMEHAIVIPEAGWGGVMSLLWMLEVKRPGQA